MRGFGADLMQIELAESEKEWTLHNAWFVKQSDFNVRLRVREKPL